MSANVLESRDHLLISFKFSESECFIVVSYCCLAGFILCTYEHFYFFKYIILYTH